MAADPKARKFSINWSGGYLTTTRYVLEAIYGPQFMDKVGAGQAQTVSVKGHPRQRVIGGPSITVAPHTYGMIKYPRKVKSVASGGQPIQIKIGDDWWTARLGGSVQDFKAFLAGVGKPLATFDFATAKGSEYSSAS